MHTKNFKSKLAEQFYKINTEAKNHFYCVEDDAVELDGTKSRQFRKENHKYVIVEIWKCTNETRTDGDPQCAGPDQIERWIRHKSAMFKVISNQVNYDNRNELSKMKRSRECREYSLCCLLCSTTA